MGFLLEDTKADVLQELTLYVPAAASLKPILHSP